MPGIVIVGVQWGDEGKGKATDLLGERTDWVVASVHSYRKTSLPPEIFGTDGSRMLTLVTCGGEIVQTPDGRWTHEDNIVVIAVPAE